MSNAKSIDVNGIANTVYHGAVVSGISLGYAMLSSKLFKIKPPDFNKLSAEDALKLTALSSGALATQGWLVGQGILPSTFPMGGPS